MATNKGASASSGAARRAASTARRAAADDEIFVENEPVSGLPAGGDAPAGEPTAHGPADQPRPSLVDDAKGSESWLGDADENEAPRPIERKLTVAPVRKTKPTPKRDQSGQAEHHATTPAQFVRQSIGELRKVVWPSGETVRQYWIVVLVFVAFIMAFVSLLDYGLGQLLLKLIG